MITNIFLGLILVIIIISFIILNNKINIIQDYLGTTIRKLNSINSVVDGINNSNCHLLERFNKRILVNEEYFNIIKDLLNNRFKDIDNATDSIYDRINTFDSDTQNLIIAEHRCTRNEIKKQAKISSKINSKTKTNKSLIK